MQTACVTAGFFPQRRAAPSPPNLPISAWARYGESDDDVLEQLLQGQLRQEMGAKLPRQRAKRIPDT